MKSLTATEMANIEKCITGPGWDGKRYTKGKQGDFIINVVLIVLQICCSVCSPIWKKVKKGQIDKTYDLSDESITQLCNSKNTDLTLNIWPGVL